jgi:hypothetical protein
VTIARSFPTEIVALFEVVYWQGSAILTTTPVFSAGTPAPPWNVPSAVPST